ncbi:hypothetical protein M427DRAFT_234348 [Gonapodya prolifera JEL478]|uniref:SWIM-type domain-containing protein n=1 Tax=Gonapodya prolifera (strain JEL478) TaxID=1344416 RepID=A0A139AM92_GONPJ|nr:hypothetical protein M427DRAFT_234348 [Gonapodya prolifera JEL478]|eukprot:KXS17869.1 hypothetical protein M427DRAFT_234348 [Gonapodya prolifera JEL478]
MPHFRQKISHELERFTVLGSTGNVYTVDIGRLVSCDCPDAAKGHLCKHHLFVMLRVLRVSPNNPSVWQTALLSSELLEIFNAAPPDPRLVAKTEVRAAWKKTVGLDSAEEEQEAETIDSEAGARDIEEGAECPTCYESLTDRTRATTHCITCRNSIHKDCLTTWKQACQSQHRPITCVYCRSDWVDVDQRNPSGAKAAANVSEGYLNFGRAVGLPQARDTSTYSSWPEW